MGKFLEKVRHNDGINHSFDKNISSSHGDYESRTVPEEL